MKTLEIYIDETGDFGFSKNSSLLYGVSFTFHEINNDISKELLVLNNRLQKIGYTGMIHMADLIMKRGDYTNFDMAKRKSIFNAIYQFSKRINANYKSIIIDKKYNDSKKILKQQITYEIYNMLEKNKKYFNSFKKIIIYYDNGQDELAGIIDNIFSNFHGFEHIVQFNHIEKRLFQVSDMLTYLDKYNYKYQHKMKFAKSENYFFSKNDIRRTLKELSNKRL